MISQLFAFSQGRVIVVDRLPLYIISTKEDNQSQAKQTKRQQDDEPEETKPGKLHASPP